jgi:cytochrome c553
VRRRHIGPLAAALLVLGCPAEESPPAPPQPHRAESPKVADELAQALALPGDPQAGARAYETCAVCHLPSGAGRPDGTFPVLAGQHARVIIKQIVDVREGRRRNPVAQPHLLALAGPQEIADVAAYIATLPPVEGSDDLGDGGALDEGRRLYERDCAGCHGARGEGDASRFVPVIAGQHYAYLLRQLRNIAGGRRRDSHPGMLDVARHYRDAELRAVADYVARLGREAPPAP